MAIDNISMVGGQKALLGIGEIAERRDIDLFCFHLDLNQGIERLPAAWSSLAKIVDGLVVFQAWKSEERFQAFRARFPGLPMVNAARLYALCPGVAPDSYGGMRELVDHLVSQHSCRKIAFVTGPEGNWPVQERYRAYSDALAERGIALDPKLVTPNLFWDGGSKAVTILIDERGLRPGVDFDALIGSNDSMALGAIEELRTRGVSVPGDVAVVGFDNDARSAFSFPPLTTAEYNMGSHAAEILLDLLDGKAVPDRSFAPTRVLVRSSCGCRSTAVAGAAAVAGPDRAVGGIRRSAAALSLRSSLPLVLDRVGAALRERSLLGEASAALLRPPLERLAEAIESDGDDASDAYLRSLEASMRSSGEAGSGMSEWQEVLSILRREVLPYAAGDGLRRAESLWHQSRVMIEEATRREGERQAYQAGLRTQSQRDIEQALLTSLSVAGITETLEARLPALGVSCAYLALYADTRSEATDGASPGSARMVLAFRDATASERGRVDLGPEGRAVEPSVLVPADALPARRASFVIEPLNFHESQLGFAVLELGPRDGSVYDNLRGTISGALQSALLLDQVRRSSEQLESIVSQTRTTSEEMQASVAETTRQTRKVSDAAQVSIEVSKKGQAAVAETISGMETVRRQVEETARSILDLSSRTNQIGEIIRAVEDIVGQSDVLAINASIQAARAGALGKGFSVVAREMRALAEKSRDATAHINEILEDIRRAAQSAVAASEAGSAVARVGMDKAGRAGEAIENLAATIETAARVALEISSGTGQQTDIITQLVDAVRSIQEASDLTSTSFKAARL